MKLCQKGKKEAEDSLSKKQPVYPLLNMENCAGKSDTHLCSTTGQLCFLDVLYRGLAGTAYTIHNISKCFFSLFWAGEICPAKCFPHL